MLPGEMRFIDQSHLLVFMRAIQAAYLDVFVATYEEYVLEATILSEPKTGRVLIYDRSELLDFGIPTQLNQFFLLQELISHFRAQLSMYQVIVKSRTDVFVSYCEITNLFGGIAAKALYARSDSMRL